MALTFSLKLEGRSPIEVEEGQEGVMVWRQNSLTSCSNVTFSYAMCILISVSFLTFTSWKFSNIYKSILCK